MNPTIDLIPHNCVAPTYSTDLCYLPVLEDGSIVSSTPSNKASHLNLDNGSNLVEIFTGETGIILLL